MVILFLLIAVLFFVAFVWIVLGGGEGMAVEFLAFIAAVMLLTAIFIPMAKEYSARSDSGQEQQVISQLDSISGAEQSFYATHKVYTTKVADLTFTYKQSTKLKNPSDIHFVSLFNSQGIAITAQIHNSDVTTNSYTEVLENGMTIERTCVNGNTGY